MYVQTKFSAHIVKANIKGIECGIQLLSLRSKCLDSANQPTRKRDTCFDSILKTPREYLELMAVRKQGILVPCMLAVGLTWSAHRLAPSSPSSSSYVFLPLSLFLFPSLFSLHLFIITRPLALSFSLSLSHNLILSRRATWRAPWHTLFARLSLFFFFVLFFFQTRDGVTGNSASAKYSLSLSFFYISLPLTLLLSSWSQNGLDWIVSAADTPHSVLPRDEILNCKIYNSAFETQLSLVHSSGSDATHWVVMFITHRCVCVVTLKEDF